MKKRIWMAFMLLMVTSGFTSLMILDTVKADDGAAISRVEISQYPSKIVYCTGESLDFSDMVFTCYYFDGSSRVITDYAVEGYDSNKIGIQMVVINHHNYTQAFLITVVPAKVTNISSSGHTLASITLTWDALEGVNRYEIFRADDVTGYDSLAGVTGRNGITLDVSSGTLQKYRICAITNIGGIEYRGEFSDPYTAVASPVAVSGLKVTESTESSIALSWNEVPGATGYLIYRSPASSDSYKSCGMTNSASYKDNTPVSGTSYKYKVCAYRLEQSNTGDFSSEVDISTSPAKMVLKYKSGDRKVRLTWTKVTGATFYDIYIGEDHADLSQLTTIEEAASSSYIVEGLDTGETYSFYAIAHREYNGAVYDSPASDIISVTVEEIEDTNTDAILFSDLMEFQNSWAYSKLEFFGTNVDFSKSIVIPGLATTNVGGFSSTSMCPQGIAFAEDYLLLTAYDIAGEENSVVYVMDKASGELLTTVILPVKAHVGGITYDGTDIWITIDNTVSSLPFAKVQKAAKVKRSSVYIDFEAICELGVPVSFVTYYDDKLWVGYYNELKSTRMYSFMISNKKDTPSLTKVDSILMPTRVQGIAFTDDGYLILSRSCQLHKGLRGYMRQLDLYRPVFSDKEGGMVSLGDLIRTVGMPSMNEGIAIDGSYLYVNFESAVFESSSYKMDRICAFELSSIITGISY